MKPGTSGVNAVSIILEHQNRASALYNKSLEKKVPVEATKSWHADMGISQM